MNKFDLVKNFELQIKEIVKDNHEKTELTKYFDFINSLTGDAIFNFFQTLLFLEFLNMDIRSLSNLFIRYEH